MDVISEFLLEYPELDPAQYELSPIRDEELNDLLVLLDEDKSQEPISEHLVPASEPENTSIPEVSNLNEPGVSKQDVHDDQHQDGARFKGPQGASLGTSPSRPSLLADEGPIIRVHLSRWRRPRIRPWNPAGKGAFIKAHLPEGPPILISSNTPEKGSVPIKVHLRERVGELPAPPGDPTDASALTKTHPPDGPPSQNSSSGSKGKGAPLEVHLPQRKRLPLPSSDSEGKGAPREVHLPQRKRPPLPSSDSEGKGAPREVHLPQRKRPPLPSSDSEGKGAPRKVHLPQEKQLPLSSSKLAGKGALAQTHLPESLPSQISAESGEGASTGEHVHQSPRNPVCEAPEVLLQVADPVTHREKDPREARAKRRRTRRGGRAYQLRKLLRSYYAPSIPSSTCDTEGLYSGDSGHPSLPQLDPEPPGDQRQPKSPCSQQHPEPSSDQRKPKPPCSQQHTEPSRKQRKPKLSGDPPRVLPRIVSERPFTGRIKLRVLEWKLHRLDLSRPVYPEPPDPTDPRHPVYLAKRVRALYPLPAPPVRAKPTGGPIQDSRAVSTAAKVDRLKEGKRHVPQAALPIAKRRASASASRTQVVANPFACNLPFHSVCNELNT